MRNPDHHLQDIPAHSGGRSRRDGSERRGDSVGRLGAGRGGCLGGFGFVQRRRARAQHSYGFGRGSLLVFIGNFHLKADVGAGRGVDDAAVGELREVHGDVFALVVIGDGERGLTGVLDGIGVPIPGEQEKTVGAFDAELQLGGVLAHDGGGDDALE